MQGRGARNEAKPVCGAVVALLVVATALAAGLVAVRGQHAAAQYGDAGALPSAEVQLLPPWNFVTATLGGPVEEVFAGVDAVVAVFRWDAPRVDFDSWQRSAPLPSLNSLQVINAGDALWVLVSAAALWVQPLPAEERMVDFVTGWNTVGWTGPATGADVVAPLLGASALITFNAAAQSFLRFDAAAMALLNSLGTVPYRAGVWAPLGAPGSATIPRPLAPPAPDESPDQPPPPAPMQLTSTAFAQGEPIPVRYTCDGVDVSPPLTVSGVPEDAVSLALIMDDPDAPGGTWVHWVAYNIDPAIAEIPEGIMALGTEGTTSFGSAGYGGLCPPSGTHPILYSSNCSRWTRSCRCRPARPKRNWRRRWRVGSWRKRN